MHHEEEKTTLAYVRQTLSIHTIHWTVPLFYDNGKENTTSTVQKTFFNLKLDGVFSFLRSWSSSCLKGHIKHRKLSQNA